MTRRPIGLILLSAFFAIATLILVGVGLALLLPSSPLEAIWRLYPARRAELTPYRLWMGPGFLALAVTMAAASVGCLTRRRWGWILAVAIFTVNGVSDLAQLVMGRWLEGGVGVAAAGAILFYLFRPRIRAAFCHLRR